MSPPGLARRLAPPRLTPRSSGKLERVCASQLADHQRPGRVGGRAVPTRHYLPATRLRRVRAASTASASIAGGNRSTGLDGGSVPVSPPIATGSLAGNV